MKLSVLRPVELDVDAIRVSVPIRYDEDLEQLRANSLGMFVTGRTLCVTLGLDGRVRDWPGGAASVHTKVVDQGTYELLSGDEVVAAIRADYVPGCLPGEHYGDYLILDIAEDGTVLDWSNRKRSAESVAESFGMSE